MSSADAGSAAVHITAQDNPSVVRAARVASESAFARRERLCWIDGDHLLRAAFDHGLTPAQCFITPDGWDDLSLRKLVQRGSRVAIVPRALLKRIAAVETPSNVGALVTLPSECDLDPHAPTVVLDRVQDPGNVGTILRSASAFGFTQIIALKGSAAIWSTKVVRAAMGAHFALKLIEGEASLLDRLQVPCLGTSSHAQEVLGASAALPFPCAWLLGHEGGGLEHALLGRCARVIRIPQPGGQESLNVAMAAAICFYESRRGNGG